MRKYETVEEREDRIAAMMEEAAKPTGYDLLLESKEKNLRQMKELMAKEPELSRPELAKRLGVSIRTLYRYLTVFWEGKGIKPSTTSETIKEKERRKTKLVALMKKKPTASVSWLAAEVGVSRRTLYSYLNELEQ